jgi:hypothetical protein
VCARGEDMDPRKARNDADGLRVGAGHLALDPLWRTGTSVPARSHSYEQAPMSACPVRWKVVPPG